MDDPVSYENADNVAAVNAMHTIMFEHMPARITHGEFNRLMFLKAFVFEAGIDCCVEQADVCDYAGITPKEFEIIRDEYIAKGVIVEKGVMYGVTMYELNLTFKGKVQDNILWAEKNKQRIEDLKDRRVLPDRRIGERRKVRSTEREL